jgi:hypothetical protein
VPWGVRALGISATGTQPSALNAATASLRERSPSATFYALGLREAAWDYDPAPQVLNVPIRLEFPWNRGEAAAPEHAEAYGTELAGALAQVEADMAAELADFARRQLRWYADHRQLRIDLCAARSDTLADLWPEPALPLSHDHEANLAAKGPAAEARPRIPPARAHQEWPPYPQGASPEGA